MLIRTIPLDKKHNYSANAVDTVELPKIGLLTDLIATLEVQYDTGGGPSKKEDALARLVKGWSILDGTGKPYFSIEDGRQLKYLNLFQYKGQLRHDDVTTNANQSNQKASAVFKIHPGFKPQINADLSSGIKAEEKLQLISRLTWGAASDLGSDYTIDWATISFIATYAILEPGETFEDIAPNFVTPLPNMIRSPINNVLGNLAHKVPLPSGGVLVRSTIVVLNSSGNRANDQVSEVGYKTPIMGQEKLRIAWTTLQDQNKGIYDIDTMPTGVAAVNWAQVAGGVGLDLSEAKAGEHELLFSTLATGGEILILHEMYK